MSQHLKEKQLAPDFTAQLWDGGSFQLSSRRGKKLWLAFFRYASCPLCNLRVHEMIQQYDTFQKAGMQMVAVFQSPKESIGEYVGKQQPPFPVRLKNLWVKKVERRKTFIKPHELPKWFQAVNNLKQVRSDELTFAIKYYLLLLLFTGLRREELAQLKWENVDLQDRSFTLKSHTTKNREEHVVPMSGYVASIFETLHEARDGPYVFPGKNSKAYLKSPRKHMLRVTKESGVSFNLHDLRRTFITIAESLDISIFTIKRLINHKISQDVTGGYIISYTDRLRKATQMVTDHILSIIKQGMPTVTEGIEPKVLLHTHIENQKQMEVAFQQ